jgi:UDP-2-acetamido-2,6-beta-L-arabino-hexul-4-ose reductase
MKFLVTGANGFIGKNLVLQLKEQGHEVVPYLRNDDLAVLEEAVVNVDGIFHLAGENRPADVRAFEQVNFGLTQQLCEALIRNNKKTPLILASSAQAALESPYGISKRSAEDVVNTLAESNKNPIAVYRLPGVFGKWCRPNYNSVVATFCHNVANDLSLKINDPSAVLNLVYVDDVVTSFINTMHVMCSTQKSNQANDVKPVYSISLGELAEQIKAFQNCRASLVSEQVGTGFVRALYSTYVSYLPKDKFVYDLTVHGDARGVFVEMLKTPDSGQFSFFTAHPGVTRGGHYHHSKTEKFLVIKGQAKFGFRHMLTNETFAINTAGAKPQVVETVPGWTHDITNVGEDEMIVMLWANEIFDRDRPDTFVSKV